MSARPEPREAARLRAHAYRTLKVLVADRGVGQRLPSERELAEELGMGRAIVRAALRDLRAEGLVGTRRQAGSFAHPGT